jgi:hypothetical protein
MELRDALTQIAEIRLQMARHEVFRGYRAAPVAFTGLLALAASWVQAVWIPDPAHHVGAYLGLWIGAAVLGAVAAAAGMVLAGSARSAWRRRITWLAVEQFVPCLVAGGMVTAVLVPARPESVWLLPGLWQVLFSLGVFASCRLLPRPTFAVGVFYLLSGTACLALARDQSALAPWAMGIPFGFGQLLTAAILYWTLERADGEV